MNGVIGMTDLLLDSRSAPSSATRRDHPRPRAIAAHGDQRHPGFLEDRGGQARDRTAPSSTCVNWSRSRAAGRHRATRRKLESSPTSIRRCRRVQRRSRAAAAGPGQPLGNAVKFTAQGEVALHARSAGAECAVELLRFAVRDTGIGIPADACTSCSSRSCRPTARPRAASAAPVWACRSPATGRADGRRDRRHSREGVGSTSGSPSASAVSDARGGCAGDGADGFRACAVIRVIVVDDNSDQTAGY